MVHEYVQREDFEEDDAGPQAGFEEEDSTATSRLPYGGSVPMQVRFYLLRTIETSHLPNQNPESRGVEEQYVLPRANVTVAKRGSQNNDVASAVKIPSASDTLHEFTPLLMSLKTNVWILELVVNAEHLFNNYNIDLFIEYVEFVALGLPQTSPADLSPKCLQRCATTSAAFTPHARDDKFEMHPARSRTPVLHVQEQSLEDRYGTPQTFPGITRVNLHTKMAEMSQRIVTSTWFQRFLWPLSSARSTLCFTTPTR
ncbi:hypothetical protein J4E85_007331 [Alternaria conjuncta]|uniref:uncharacterized protein n=1 Tax=Alternaria conjuncta TaxID=181017 RepID=UPI0022201C1C|nr:uncharacterized protein J4E85_007331 [Alternaria conjuncta]KAI4925452.1 hypothetical protein J4E85_007331 [Alternaria conjuncta]